MNKIIDTASKKGVSEIETFFKDTVSQEVRYENNALKNISSSQNSGMGLRGIYDNKMGVASFTNEAHAEKAIDRLIDSSKYSEPKEFDFANPDQYKAPNTYDKSIENISIEKLVKDGQKIIDEVRQYDKNLLTNVSFGSDIETTRISNSKGVNGEYKKSAFMAYISGRIIEGTSFIETDCLKYGIDGNYNIDELINNFIERIKLARVETNVSSGRTNIMFTPKAFVDILTTVSQGVNGNSIEKGISPLCNRIGEKIFDERFTLIDDGTIDNHVGSSPFDDEGIPTRRSLVFENGVLKSYIHSIKTASRTKSEVTGNGSRGSYDTLPTPSFNNMIINPGNESFESLVEKMGNGIIIDEIMGLSMNNLLNGDFGGNIQLGLAVKNGKIEGRVKNAVFNASIYHLLKDNLIGFSDLNYNHPIVNSIFSAKRQPCAVFKGINVTIK